MAQKGTDQPPSGRGSRLDRGSGWMTDDLAIHSVAKAFGGITALFDCSLVVRAGSITALIGPNGSGKTTLFNCVTGFYRPEQGDMRFGNAVLVGLRPNEVVHLGIARTFQVTRIFKNMTVLENMIVPIRQLGLRTLFTAGIKGHERQRAEELLEFFGIAFLRDELAGRLSFGQQKLLELAAALMAEPKLLMLDEPAGGLNPVMIDRLTAYIRELNAGGMTFRSSNTTWDSSCNCASRSSSCIAAG